ncbi:RNA-binding protein EEED8.10 [Oopsacas minuta]|uniref:RNA-binding protein EEED8.10 n=1 Tax=Oopsacas minuta TaxID=111878 RepID=A0AAV7JDR1_9METZ|nr:RNA-binding protein EEED8.10 [Oopsacas minuta]
MSTKISKNYKLFVSNVPFSSGYQEVHDIFAKFGPIKNCVLPSKRGPRGNRESSGTAIVTFYDNQSMRLALARNSKLTMDGRALHIQLSLPKRTKIPSVSSDDSLLQLEPLYYPDTHTSNHHVTTIPTIAWLHILSLLDISALCRMDSTCRFLHSVCRQYWYLKKSISFKNVFCIWRFTSSTIGLTNELLAILLSRTGPSLLSLDVSGSARLLTPGSLQIISHYAPQLTTLDLSGITLSLEPVQKYFSCCTNLRNLSLVGCTGLSEKILWWIIKAKGDLIYLNISESKRVSGNCLRMLNGSLLHFNACGCSRLSPLGVSYLCSTSPALLSLNLEHCYSLTSQSLRDISQCINLISLQFPSTIKTHENIASLPFQLELCNIHNLKCLDLSHQLQLTDSFLLTLVNIPLLSSLKIPGCYLVTDIGISHLNNCPLLTTLDISYLNLITDTGLVTLHINLHSLTARMCMEISNLALSSILESSTSLVYMDVSGCIQVTSGCFPSLAAHLQRDLLHTSPYWGFGGTSVTEEDVHNFFEETGVRLSLQDSSNSSLAYRIDTDIFIPAPPVTDYTADDTQQAELIEVTKCISEDDPTPLPPVLPPTNTITIPSEENWDDDCAPHFFSDNIVYSTATQLNVMSEQYDENLGDQLINHLVSDDVTYREDMFELS